MDALTRKIRKLEAGNPKVKQLRQVWLASLETLFAQVEGWLAEEISNTQISISRTEIVLSERQLGVFQGTKVEFQIRHKRVALVPRGMHVLGAIIKDGDEVFSGEGRADLYGDFGSFVAFYKGPSDTWYVPTPAAPEAWARLDKQTFRAALASLL